ncbi:MAG: AEC family transporter [Desulfonatronovibrionaceae bacterium]
MHVFYSLVNAIIVIILIYGLAVLLRRKKVLAEEHSLVLARVVTDLCLPAMIFVTLAGLTIVPRELIPAFVMLGLELSCIAAAWILCVLLGFARPQQGAIVFCSAFGSSAFLGYALIMQVYPDNPQVLGQTVLISEIGVGYPIFILGPMLAAYFGAGGSRIQDQWKASLAFFRSPVFFALIAGILWSVAGLPEKDNPLTAPVFKLGHVLASALTPMAILSVGLMFKIPRLQSILLPLAIVIGIKLLAKPLLAGFAASSLGLPGIWEQILVLLSAMPPAVLGVVFLKRYGGDAGLASALLLVASLISCATIIGVFAILI